jgi:hypothetical protein
MIRIIVSCFAFILISKISYSNDFLHKKIIAQLVKQDSAGLEVNFNARGTYYVETDELILCNFDTIINGLRFEFLTPDKIVQLLINEKKDINLIQMDYNVNIYNPLTINLYIGITNKKMYNKKFKGLGLYQGYSWNVYSGCNGELDFQTKRS